MKEYILISTEGPYFSLFYKLAFMIALLLLIYEGHRRKFPMMKWLTYPEMPALAINVIVAVKLMGSRLIQNFYHSPKRWLYLASLFVPLATMAQTVPDDVHDSLLVKTYKSVSISFGSGKLINYKESQTVSWETFWFFNIPFPSRRVIKHREYFEQKYKLVSTGFSITNENPDLTERWTYGLHAVGGQHIETGLSSRYEKKHELVGIIAYINYDEKWIGVGGGLHLGSLRYVNKQYFTEHLLFPGRIEENADKDTKWGFYPRLYARIGPERIFFVDYRLANHFPFALPGYNHQLGIGTGFGSRSGLMGRFGTTTIYSYLAGNIPIQDKVVFEPILLWRSKDKADKITPPRQVQFSFGLSYRFGHETSSGVSGQ